MKIAIYSRKRVKHDLQVVRQVVQLLQEMRCETALHTNISNELLKNNLEYVPALFSNYETLKQLPDVDFMMSVGGDGTFIDSANMVGDLGIPLVGLNTGRIGFLAGTNKHNFKEHLQQLLNGQYEIEERALLHLECDTPLPLQTHFALNDITVRPSDETSINAIRVWLNGEQVNTYWADGLIIATPSGSTAYSLSCGGPILLPSTQVNILTPIASHTLAVRPVVVPAQHEIKITVESRSKKFALALDSKRVLVQSSATLTITPEQFTIKMVRFPKADFFTIIREKLMWGLDWRNIAEN
jgi:NAD+ kinase